MNHARRRNRLCNIARVWLFAPFLCCSIFTFVAAQEAVDLELVLLADGSHSIDKAEIDFQRQGYADALMHPDTQAAIADGIYQRIALTYVEWGGPNSQYVVVPWRTIKNPASAAQFVTALASARRRSTGYNAIGSALKFAQRLIEENLYIGLKRVIDFSGDSATNWSGLPVAPVRQDIVQSGIVINGLAILCRAAQCNGRPVHYDLEEAFRQSIIGGPGSFVITADNRQTFAAAVRRKLVLEIAAPAKIAPKRYSHRLLGVEFPTIRYR